MRGLITLKRLSVVLLIEPLSYHLTRGFVPVVSQPVTKAHYLSPYRFRTAGAGTGIECKGQPPQQTLDYV